jgi:hypothetical protein
VRRATAPPAEVGAAEAQAAVEVEGEKDAEEPGIRHNLPRVLLHESAF